MDPLLPIGEFSKMTYLSVKALRHYHDVGLLEPAAVDPATGYRRYTPAQVATAQAIRRFRDLDMPIEEVRRVLDAPDEASRNRAILVHLERMQQQLEQTQATVASLQALLGGGGAGAGRDAAVEVRRLPPARVLAVRAHVAFDDAGAWLEPALEGLHTAAAAAGLEIAGPDGALYPDELFADGSGEMTGFVPVTGDAPDVEALEPITVAVLVHRGAFADLDQAYGALGTAVAERGIGGPGPIREHYLDGTTTEVCWPVTFDVVAS